MIGKFVSSFYEDDGGFLRTLIGLSIINIALIFWLGMNMPGNPAFLPTVLNVTPMVAQSIEPVLPQPIIKPIQRVIKQLPKPEPIASITKKQAEPEPPGGGVLKRIIFSSDRGGNRFYQLYMIDSNGNNLEQLTYTTAFDRDPHVSHDGKTVVFASNRFGNYQIFKMDLKTKTVQQLTWGKKDKANPIWSPDNKKLLFTIHDGPTSYLGMMNADGSQVTYITKKGGNHYGYGFSPDSKKISYEGICRDRHQIYLYDLEKKQSLVLIDHDNLADVGDPVFSPKENILVFTSDSLKHHKRQLYTYDVDLNYTKRLTHDLQDKDDPIYSPDGKMIAYIGKWNNAWNIYVMNADGTGARNITKSAFDHVVPSWR